MYVLDRPDARNDCLRVLDLASGAEEWTYSYAAAGKVALFEKLSPYLAGRKGAHHPDAATGTRRRGRCPPRRVAGRRP